MLHDQKIKKLFKYLENENSFFGEIKNIFHQFQRLKAKNCLRTESALLIEFSINGGEHKFITISKFGTDWSKDSTCIKHASINKS